MKSEMRNRALPGRGVDDHLAGRESRSPQRPLERCAAISLAALLAVLTMVPATGIDAQMTATDQSQAEQLAAEALELAATGDYEVAVSKLRSSLEIDPQQHVVRFQLARILAALGRYEEARAEFAAIVAALPQNSAARRGEVTALLLSERYADARRKLEEGLTALPRDGQLAHTLARLLASSPDPEVRDGELALRLALQVYEIKKLYETAETLAMAYAEQENFEKAIEIERSLIARAEAEGDEQKLTGLRQRLESFERSESWVAVSPVEIATATEPPDAAESDSR
jgi:tetratricopeptide (TPR) repeat protein